VYQETVEVVVVVVVVTTGPLVRRAKFQSNDHYKYNNTQVFTDVFHKRFD